MRLTIAVVVAFLLVGLVVVLPTLLVWRRARRRDAAGVPPPTPRQYAVRLAGVMTVAALMLAWYGWHRDWGGVVVLTVCEALFLAAGLRYRLVYPRIMAGREASPPG